MNRHPGITHEFDQSAREKYERATQGDDGRGFSLLFALPFHTERPECYSDPCFLCMSKSGMFLCYAFRSDCTPAKDM